MRFNLEELNPGVWIALDEDHPEQGKLCLRVANGEALDEIKKKTHKKRVEIRRGQRFEVEEVNEALYDELLWDYCIVDWEGILDAKGKPIPCTRENKVRLLRGSPLFLQLYIDCIGRLDEYRKQALEEEEKN